LIALRSLDKTLRPIAEIKSLVTLRTAWWWKVEEFAYLRDKLPNLRYGNPLEEDAIREFARQ
jgi:hypothetical protein